MLRRFVSHPSFVEAKRAYDQRRSHSRFGVRSSRAIPRYSRRYDSDSFVSGKKSLISATVVAYARDAFERDVSMIPTCGTERCRECNFRKIGALGPRERRLSARDGNRPQETRDRARPVPVYHSNGKTVRVRKQVWEIVRITRRKRHK